MPQHISRCHDYPTKLFTTQLTFDAPALDASDGWSSTSTDCVRRIRGTPGTSRNTSRNSASCDATKNFSGFLRPARVLVTRKRRRDNGGVSSGAHIQGLHRHQPRLQGATEARPQAATRGVYRHRPTNKRLEAVRSGSRIFVAAIVAMQASGLVSCLTERVAQRPQLRVDARSDKQAHTVGLKQLGHRHAHVGVRPQRDVHEVAVQQHAVRRHDAVQNSVEA